MPAGRVFDRRDQFFLLPCYGDGAVVLVTVEWVAFGLAGIRSLPHGGVVVVHCDPLTVAADYAGGIAEIGAARLFGGVAVEVAGEGQEAVEPRAATVAADAAFDAVRRIAVAVGKQDVSVGEEDKVSGVLAGAGDLGGGGPGAATVV